MGVRVRVEDTRRMEDSRFCVLTFWVSAFTFISLYISMLSLLLCTSNRIK